MTHQPNPPQGAETYENIHQAIAIASGKGGVGKSTVSVNLSVALAATGARVGLMDADIYGPNIPMMMGVRQAPQVSDGKIQPVEKHGVKMVSMGFFLQEDEPVVWRGPMIHGALRQFLSDVNWGELDYMLIDLPPGTGDAQISLSQLLPLTGAVIVTTPQSVSLADAKKAIMMFERVRVPILGLIENMSYFLVPGTNERHEIFSHGGGRQFASLSGYNLLGEVPLNTAIREGGDAGVPITLGDPDSEPARVFREAAGTLIQICASNAPTERKERQSVVFQPPKG
ncbi:MAG: ATP-binding protein [Candidatus Omnitrophica bacterium]|nr:MAG: Septum site-determining protein MinD [Candidatus Hinthialibacteria bacterium OLB16]MBE7488282.1 Mrp/NBP35 family ATP-binding protein [bacterium]MBK7494901.1 Mrp/NBP35 family ATP-binding protein [Candidatus Omnitrophota bacterium]MCE7908449.1 ATP-binding protein [Candidatus Omnitrophica bacterium COP1]MBV6480493.1 Iron-sulfur cluster carrier protein [bacterium]